MPPATAGPAIAATTGFDNAMRVGLAVGGSTNMVLHMIAMAIEAGVDVLYAERAGVVDAAREKGIVAFGNVNDMNKEENGTDVVVTSALWHMENAINHAIKLVKDGKFAAEDYKEWTMMQKGGASLAPYYEFEDRIASDIKAKVEETKAAILAGSYTVEINDEEPKSTY